MPRMQHGSSEQDGNISSTTKKIESDPSSSKCTSIDNFSEPQANSENEKHTGNL